MKLIRARNPVAIDYMKDKLELEAQDFEIDALVDNLKAALVDFPEETLLLQAWEGKELAGFLLAFDMRGQKHVFFQQVWVNAKYPDLADKMFFRLLVWVDNLGKKEIRGETVRDVDVVERRWGFKPFSRVLSFIVPDDYETKLLQNSHSILIGDKENGIELKAKNKDNVDPIGGAESSQPDTVKADRE